MSSAQRHTAKWEQNGDGHTYMHILGPNPLEILTKNGRHTFINEGDRFHQSLDRNQSLKLAMYSFQSLGTLLYMDRLSLRATESESNIQQFPNVFLRCIHIASGLGQRSGMTDLVRGTTTRLFASTTANWQPCTVLIIRTVTTLTWEFHKWVTNLTERH